MKKLIILTILLVAGAISVKAQTECPPDKVCLSPEAARAALQAGDKVIALEAELMTVKQALLDQKLLTVDVKIELAKQIGEKTGAQQENVRQSAIIQFLLTNGRKKCGVLSLCIQ